MKNFKTKLFGAMLFLLVPAVALASPSGDLQRILQPVAALFNLGGEVDVASGGKIKVKSGGTLELASGSTLTISNAASFATLGATTIQAGASGTAGVVKAFPGTASNGFMQLLPVNNTGAFNSSISNKNIGQTTVYSLPECSASTCDLLATTGAQTVTGVKTFTTPALGAATATSINGIALTAGTGTLTITGTKTLGASNTLTLAAGADGQTFTFPATTDTVAGLAAAQTFTGVNTFGAASAINSKTATSTVDIAPPFDTRLRGNPVVKIAYGNALIADINAGNATAIILTGESTRKITVMSFDLVAAGSAATCTGIYLTDSSSVRVATIAAAQLTSGAHNVPLTATLGVGFGAGTGLTAGASLQLLVNGAGCTTTTSVQYAVVYAIQ